MNPLYPSVWGQPRGKSESLYLGANRFLRAKQNGWMVLAHSQVAKANGEHKKNVWEIIYVLNLFWNAIKVFTCPLDCVFWLNFLGVSGGCAQAMVIWAWFRLSSPRDLKRVSEHFYCISVQIRGIHNFSYILIMFAIRLNSKARIKARIKATKSKNL